MTEPAEDLILEQWQAEPGLDVSPMAVIGRLSSASLTSQEQATLAHLLSRALD